MTIPTLGALTEVELRDAWNHEAHSFTPWLAANLDALADKIGIPLELEGQEVPVETFAADILARNPLDDSLVLIENQLEGTDHTHLGQIMTYLAGLDAHTVVWVAKDFREPHLSALKWLNDHTVEPFAFFAVKVKAVRIGDSPIAPVFEVMVRPNHWERQLQAIAKETRQISSRGQFRRDFWTDYVAHYPREENYGPVMGVGHRWHLLKALDLVVSLYMAKTEVGVYIRGPEKTKGVEIYQRLLPHADRLSQLTGAEFGKPEREHFFYAPPRAILTTRRSGMD